MSFSGKLEAWGKRLDQQNRDVLENLSYGAETASGGITHSISSIYLSIFNLNIHKKRG